MIKLLKFVAFVLVLTSCNSSQKDKTTSKVEYPEKTELKPQNADLKASIAKGQTTYNDMCITCHLADGKGVPKAFPPLANSDYLKANQEKSIAGIKNGMSGKMVVNGETYNSVMAGLGLTNEEVADVMNYINNSWGNDYGEFITVKDVENALENASK